MRWVPFRTLVSLLVFTALGVLDLGPRAAAGFISTADQMTTSVSTTLATDAPTPVVPAVVDRESDAVLPNPGFAPNGGTTSSPSNSSSSVGSGVAAHVPCPPSSECGLVVYFREPSARLRLSKFIDAILDPPRAI